MTMSLRLRLALWYSALTGAVVVLVCLYGYAVHSRTHYDELDVTLRRTARHFAAELARASSDAGRAQVLTSAHRLGTAVSLQDDRERPLNISSGDDATVTFLAGSRPAYPALAALAPPLLEPQPGPGAFALATDDDGVRWRAFVIPASPAGPYRLVVALPLDHLDASVRRFGRLMIIMALVGCTLTFAAGWLIAGHALRPVAALTDKARDIARSRVFAERVRVGSVRDELGRLAATFNEMLASLEGAYAAQQRFVSDASHELRAPITVIQANLELLTRHPAMPGEEREQAIAEAFGETARLGRLVADLLSLARADAGVAIRRERVELDRVLMHVLGEARHLARGQRLAVVTVEPVVVEGDPDRLRQLLLIPLDNAIRYTPPGGQITIELERRDDMAEVRVADTGIGIAEHELPRVFERFYRADPARTREPGGTGLGLAIARWIAEQHGGTVDLASRRGEGTTARIRLPALARSGRTGMRGARPGPGTRVQLTSEEAEQ